MRSRGCWRSSTWMGSRAITTPSATRPDALLARLGGKLAASTAGHGRCYRLGGDEFPLLTPADPTLATRLLDDSLEALLRARRGLRRDELVRCHPAPRACERGNRRAARGGRAAVRPEARTPVDARRAAQGPCSRRSTSGSPTSTRTRTASPSSPLPSGTHSAWAKRRSTSYGGRPCSTTSGRSPSPTRSCIVPARSVRPSGRSLRKHTVVGERIVSASPALRPVGRIVRLSHERWDGAGYPDELAGNEIPLAARIVCACDAFSAMTSRRPYHEAMSIEAALEELVRCSVWRLDPDVVAPLVALVRAGFDVTGAPEAPVSGDRSSNLG